MKKVLLVLLLLCVIPQTSWGALAVTGAIKGAAGATTTVTASSLTTATDDLIVVLAGAYQLGDNSISLVISDNASGGSMTWTASSCGPKFPNANTRVQQFYAVVPSDKARSGHTFTATRASGSNYMTVIALQITGASTTPFDVCAGAIGDSAAPNSGATATRSQADSILVGTLGTGDTVSSNTITAGSGFTIPTNGSETSYNNYVSAIEYKIVTAVGTDAADFTMTSEPWGAIIQVYKASGGAPPTPIRHRSTQ